MRRIGVNTLRFSNSPDILNSIDNLEDKFVRFGLFAEWFLFVWLGYFGLVWFEIFFPFRRRYS